MPALLFDEMETIIILRSEDSDGNRNNCGEGDHIVNAALTSVYSLKRCSICFLSAKRKCQTGIYAALIDREDLVFKVYVPSLYNLRHVITACVDGLVIEGVVITADAIADKKHREDKNKKDG